MAGPTDRAGTKLLPDTLFWELEYQASIERAKLAAAWEAKRSEVVERRRARKVAAKLKLARKVAKPRYRRRAW